MKKSNIKLFKGQIKNNNTNWDKSYKDSMIESVSYSSLNKGG